MKIIETYEIEKDVSFWYFTLENLLEGFIIACKWSLIYFFIYFLFSNLGVQAKFYTLNENTEQQTINATFTIKVPQNYERAKK